MEETVDGDRIRFRVLGPIEIDVGGRPVRPVRRCARHLLAVLAVNAGRPVPVTRLADLLWEDDRGGSARPELQVHVARLRRLLRDHRAEESGVRIVQRHGAYALLAEPDSIDSDLFRRLVSQAYAEPEPEQRMDLLASALALWREPVLDGEAALRHRVYGELENVRAAAQEEWVAAGLRLGRHREVLPELTRLAELHPTRERLAELRIRALDRSGRRTEALDVYRRARALLARELGVEPGAGLRAAHREVLRAAAARPASALPADPADFTGRRDHLAALGRVLPPRGPGRGLRVCVVSGAAGIGKTALAVHAAHRLRATFPDGQLFADLRGTGDIPAQPTEVLARFLTALGYRPREIPDGLDARAESYRGAVARSRVLVVLDDAADEAQIAPLLPGGDTCSVLVTGRARLTGLDGAGHVEVGALAADEAIALLGRIAGADRVAAEPGAAAGIAGLCAGLPLAVRIAGARLAARPHWTLTRLWSRLADESRRLDELAHGPLRVRDRLAPSYARLGADARRLFRRLSVLDGDFPGRAAAAALDASLPDTIDLLDEIVDARLLDVAERAAGGPLRFRFPGLVRLYAAERLAAEEPPEERDAALCRVLLLAGVSSAASAGRGPGSARADRPPATLIRPVPEAARRGKGLSRRTA